MLVAACTDPHAVLEIASTEYRYNGARYATPLAVINDLIESHKTRITILACPDMKPDRTTSFITMLQSSESFQVDIHPRPEACKTER